MEKVGMSGLKTIVTIAAMALMGIAAPTGAAHAQSTPQAPTLTVDTLVSYFDAVVFGSPASGSSANPLVAKWMPETLTLAIEEPDTKLDAATNKKFLGMLNAHAALLSRLTGKHFSAERNTAAADIQMYLVRRADMGKIHGPGIDPKTVEAGAAAGECYSLHWSQVPSHISKAIIVVNVDRSLALVDHCILKELTQSLGLFHDSNAMRPSIFSDKDHLTDLSLQDKILVHTLYDSRMKAGLPRAAALKEARTIIIDLGKTGK